MGEQPTASEVQHIRTKYPNHICVFVQHADRDASAGLPPLEKRKFLVPRDMTVGAFLFTVRKRMVLPAEKALFLFVENSLPVGSTSMLELFKTHGREGYLTVSCASESTFGSAANI